MKKECEEFLRLPVKPALSGALEASWVFGCDADWIPVLVEEGHLPVAGGHQPNCQFYFCTIKLIELAQDPEWVDRMVKLVRKARQKKNAAAKLKKPATSVAQEGGSNA